MGRALARDLVAAATVMINSRSARRWPARI